MIMLSALQKTLVWLENMEKELSGMGPIGPDIDIVKQQMEDLKGLKDVVHPKHLDIEELNQHAHDMTKDSPTEQAAVIREPMSDVNKRWDALLQGIADRKVGGKNSCGWVVVKIMMTVMVMLMMITKKV